MINKREIQELYDVLNKYVHTPNWNNLVFLSSEVNRILDAVSSISKGLEAEDSYLSSDIKALGNRTFVQGTFQATPFSPVLSCHRLSPYSVGALMELLDILLHSNIISDNVPSNDFNRIFISHQRSDIEQIDLFIDLLYAFCKFIFSHICAVIIIA